MEWNENANGNFVAVDAGQVTTVFRDRNGEWRGIRDGEITNLGFLTAEDAKEAIDDQQVDFVPIRPRTDTGWRSANKGGFYRQCSRGIVTVKRSKSGKWYVTVNGIFVEGQWLDTEMEAKKLADKLLE